MALAYANATDGKLGSGKREFDLETDCGLEIVLARAARLDALLYDDSNSGLDEFGKVHDELEPFERALTQGSSLSSSGFSSSMISW